MQWELVERRRWLSEAEFVELMALTQLLPGPGGLNLVVMVGHRAAGWPGVAAAVLGFLGSPFLLVFGLGMLYQQYGELPLVRQALSGMSAVAAGSGADFENRQDAGFPVRGPVWNSPKI